MSKNYLFSLLLISPIVFNMEPSHSFGLLPLELHREIIKYSIYSEYKPEYKNNFYDLLRQIYLLREVNKQWRNLIDNDGLLNLSFIELLNIAQSVHVIQMHEENVTIITKGLEAWGKQSEEEDKKYFLEESNNVNEHLGFCLQLELQQKKIEHELAKIRQINKLDMDVFAIIKLKIPAAIKFIKERIGDEKYKQALQIYNSKSDLKPI